MTAMTFLKMAFLAYQAGFCPAKSAPHDGRTVMLVWDDKVITANHWNGKIWITDAPYGARIPATFDNRNPKTVMGWWRQGDHCPPLS